MPITAFCASTWISRCRLTRLSRLSRLSLYIELLFVCIHSHCSIMDYAIYQLNPDGVVCSWNAGAQRLKGYTRAEIIGKHFRWSRANGQGADKIAMSTWLWLWLCFWCRCWIFLPFAVFHPSAHPFVHPCILSARISFCFLRLFGFHAMPCHPISSIFYTPSDIQSEHPFHELEIARKQGRFEEEGWRVRKDGSKVNITTE